MHSQADLADLLNVTRAALSQATSRGHKCGGYPVSEWAFRDGSGRVSGYDVPDWALREMKGEPNTRENPDRGTPNGLSVHSRGDTSPVDVPSIDDGGPMDDEGILPMLASQQETTRKVAEEAGDRTQLVPDGTNVEGAVRNGGLAYAAGKAIENNTPGARAFCTIASAVIGGLGGYEVSKDEETGKGSALAALLGATCFGGVGYLVYGQQPRRQEGVTPRRGVCPESQETGGGELEGRSTGAVRLTS